MGDTVRHVKFGVGIVKDIVEGGRDYEVTVDFDRAGTKKDVCRFCQAEKNLRQGKYIAFYKRQVYNRIRYRSLTGC